MSDTIVDPIEPVRATEPDLPAPPPPGAPGGPPAGGQGRSRRGRLAILAVVFAALFALGLGVVAAIYFLVLRYEPTATRHVPSNASLVFRAELSDLALFGPVRLHLWPVLLGEGGPADAAKKGPSRADRIEDETGVDVAKDLRELVVASADAESWVVAVGGKIRRGKFVSGMARVLEKEGAKGWARAGELLVGPGGVAIGQAEDGTILVGTSVAIVEAALPASGDIKESLELPEGRALGFAVTREAWAGIYGALPVLPHGHALRRVARASGFMELGASPRFELSVVPAQDEPAAALATDLEALRKDLVLVSLAMPDLAGAKEALRSAEVRAEGPRVVVSGPWPLAGLEEGCRKLAEALRPPAGSSH